MSIPLSWSSVFLLATLLSSLARSMISTVYWYWVPLSTRMKWEWLWSSGACRRDSGFMSVRYSAGHPPRELTRHSLLFTQPQGAIPTIIHQLFVIHTAPRCNTYNYTPTLCYSHIIPNVLTESVYICTHDSTAIWP